MGCSPCSGRPSRPTSPRPCSAQTEGWAAALRLAAAPLTQGMEPGAPARPRSPPTTAASPSTWWPRCSTSQPASRPPVPAADQRHRAAVARPGRPARRPRPAAAACSARWPPRMPSSSAPPARPAASASTPCSVELLQAQLAYEDPAAFAAGHRICAAWYAAAGVLSVAVEHALAADDGQLAARLLIDDLAVGRMLAHRTVGPRLPADADGTDAAVLRAATALGANHAAGWSISPRLRPPPATARPPRAARCPRPSCALSPRAPARSPRRCSPPPRPRKRWLRAFPRSGPSPGRVDRGARHQPGRRASAHRRHRAPRSARRCRKR